MQQTLQKLLRFITAIFHRKQRSFFFPRLLQIGFGNRLCHLLHLLCQNPGWIKKTNKKKTKKKQKQTMLTTVRRCHSFFYCVILPHDSASLKRMSYNVKSAKSVLFFHPTQKRNIWYFLHRTLKRLQGVTHWQCWVWQKLQCSVFSFLLCLSSYFLPFSLLFFPTTTLYAACTAYATDRHLTVCSPCRTQLLCRRYRRLQPPCVVAPDASPQRNHSNHIQNVFTCSFLTFFRHAQGDRRESRAKCRHMK